jgi:hypothetical protein
MGTIVAASVGVAMASMEGVHAKKIDKKSGHRNKLFDEG